MKTLPKLMALFAFVCCNTAVYAQTDTGLVDPPKPYLKIGVNFINNNVYLGRTDTVNTSVISPKISYTFKSGIYFSGDLEYITNKKKNPIDGGSIEAGYAHSFTDDFEGGASFTKLFYNSASTQVASALSSVFNVYADYDIADVITPALSISYSFGKNGGAGGDFLLNPNLSHDFNIDGVFGDDDRLLISPTAGLNAGSQNFYAGYLERKGRLTKKGDAVVNAVYNNYYNALSSFTLLDYEVSVPIEYKSGAFIFTFLPTYAFANDSLPKGTLAEQLITKNIEAGAPFRTSIFYFETGIAFKF